MNLSYLSKPVGLVAVVLAIAIAFMTFLKTQNSFQSQPSYYFASTAMPDINLVVTSGILREFEEPSFLQSDRKTKSRYRFLWYPSLDRTPIVIRVETFSKKDSRLIGKSGYGPPPYEIELLSIDEFVPDIESTIITDRTRRTLSTGETNKIIEMFEALNLCADAEAKGMVMDGSSWVFEYEQSNNTCARQIQSPSEAIYRNLGEYLVRLSGVKNHRFFDLG